MSGCQLTIKWMPEIKDVAMIMVLISIFLKVYIMVEEIPNFENVLLVGRNFKGTLLLAEDS